MEENRASEADSEAQDQEEDVDMEGNGSFMQAILRF
jgi:hypothetical protein